MANEEHLAKLREGTEGWNRWRNQHVDVVPDLRQADLSKADLTLADLAGAAFTLANLVGAKLTWADLREADLTGADLFGTDLSGAKLFGADLTGAKLNGAKLNGAKFNRAKFNRAKFNRTDLIRADFHETELKETVFGDIDLREVNGLDTCVHGGPSILDHRTLAKSGPLPIAFLRGCGLPEVLIDYLPSLLNQPIQFYSCFISYSTKDQGFAERLHADLQNKGVRCWFAPDDLKIGDPFRQRIDEAIRLHEKSLVILSEHSVQSAWVREEVESCFEREHREKSLVLFPVRLDSAVMETDAAWAASIRRQRHIGDFSKWKDHDSYQKAFDRLLKDLKATDSATKDAAAPQGR